MIGLISFELLNDGTEQDLHRLGLNLLHKYKSRYLRFHGDGYYKDKIFRVDSMSAHPRTNLRNCEGRCKSKNCIYLSSLEPEEVGHCVLLCEELTPTEEMLHTL